MLFPCVLGKDPSFFPGWCQCNLLVIHQQGPGVNRAGSLCGDGGLCPQREALPGAEVTRMPRNNGAFSWWRHCTVTANHRANPKYFYFEHLHPWDLKWGLENLLRIGFQDLWIGTKENSHSDPCVFFKKGADILSFGGNIKEYSKNVWIKPFIVFYGIYEYL